MSDTKYPLTPKLSDFPIMEDIPEKLVLRLADALLFSVYGWSPTKIRKMKLTSIEHWLVLAKKRMTFGDAYKMRMLLEPKRSVWKKILSKIKF